MKIKFDKQKVENAIKAVETMCLGCKEHSDDCPIVQCVKILEKLK
jgi:hypothetical protein